MYQTTAQDQLDYFAKYQKSLERIRLLKVEVRLAEDMTVDLIKENRDLKETMRRALQVFIDSGTT